MSHRLQLGAKTRKHHDLLAFYFLFDTVEDLDPARPNLEDRDTRTLIEASPSGWWYTALLPHRKRLVTYTTSPSDPTARLARNSRSFLDLMMSSPGSFFVPTLDIDLVWHTHQLMDKKYADDCVSYLGRFIDQ